MSADTSTSGMPHSLTNDSRTDKPSKTPMPTIYPNDFDYNVSIGFGGNSTGSRSFVRSTKNLGQEHRNISVPNSLKVWIDFISFHRHFLYEFCICGQGVWFEIHMHTKKNIVSRYFQFYSRSAEVIHRSGFDKSCRKLCESVFFVG